MTNEIADALRQFADRLERGELIADCSEACIVLGNEAGLTNATYLGRKVPARDAGVFMLASGIQRMVSGMQPSVPVAPAPPRGYFGTGQGSTH